MSIVHCLITADKSKAGGWLTKHHYHHPQKHSEVDHIQPSSEAAPLSSKSSPLSLHAHLSPATLSLLCFGPNSSKTSWKFVFKWSFFSNALHQVSFPVYSHENVCAFFTLVVMFVWVYIIFVIYLVKKKNLLSTLNLLSLMSDLNNLTKTKKILKSKKLKSPVKVGKQSSLSATILLNNLLLLGSVFKLKLCKASHEFSNFFSYERDVLFFSN